MANDPEADLVAYLNGKVCPASNVTLTSGSNLFNGPVRPNKSGVPSQAVFCLATGGPPAVPYMGQAIDYRASSVQVRIRSAPGGEDLGRKLARDVFGLVQRAPVTGYVFVLLQQSEPVYLGQDEQGLHEWSLNASMAWTG